jgi:uncharacterized membrane protein YidH (DUF202 family)
MSSTFSKRAKSSMNFAYLPKHRVRTKSKPSSPPHYFYTALPNDSFISDVDDSIPSPPSLSPTPPTPSTTKPSPPNHRLTSAISLTLQNSGSVARDHLASERTFLAYMRTSLALASAGVGMSASGFSYIPRLLIVTHSQFNLLGLVQLFTVATAAGRIHSGHRLHIYIQPLGAAAIVLGLVVLMIGSSHLVSCLQFLT